MSASDERTGSAGSSASPVQRRGGGARRGAAAAAAARRKHTSCWSCRPSCMLCRGRRCRRCAIARSPSPHRYDGGSTPHCRHRRRPGSALVVAGPRFAEAEAEARGVAACHRRATVLTGARGHGRQTSVRRWPSTTWRTSWPTGSFRHDNPLWSTIELDDGHLTVYELERLGRVPPTVVLATCESGVGGAARRRPAPRSGRHAADHGRTHDRRRNRSAARHRRDSRHDGRASSGSGRPASARRLAGPSTRRRPTAFRV